MSRKYKRALKMKRISINYLITRIAKEIDMFILFLLRNSIIGCEILMHSIK